MLAELSSSTGVALGLVITAGTLAAGAIAATVRSQATNTSEAKRLREDVDELAKEVAEARKVAEAAAARWSEHDTRQDERARVKRELEQSSSGDSRVMRRADDDTRPHRRR